MLDSLAHEVLPVTVGMVCGGQVTSHACQSIVDLNRRYMTSGFILRRSGPLIAHARNRVVEDFLDTTAGGHLLMVDSDIMFSPEDVVRLLQRDLDVVQGVYYRDLHGHILEARIFDEDDRLVHLTKQDVEAYRAGSLVHTDVVAAGFLLVKRHVLEKMETDSLARWFWDASDREHPCRPGVVLPEGAGEDAGFSVNLDKLQIRAYTDLSVVVGHVKSTVLRG